MKDKGFELQTKSYCIFLIIMTEENNSPHGYVTFFIISIDSQYLLLFSDYYTTVTPKFLHHVKTKIVNFDKCKHVYKQKKYLNESMICAGYTSGGMDACKVGFLNLKSLFVFFFKTNLSCINVK